MFGSPFKKQEQAAKPVFGKQPVKWKQSAQMVPKGLFGAPAKGAGAAAARKEVQMGPNDDPFLPEPPTSSIQVIAWAPQDYRLAAGCWDGSITIWEVKVEKGDHRIHRAPVQPGPMFTAENFRCPGAVLDLAWHPDGLTLYAACTDGNIYGIFFDIGDVQAIGKHSAPVKSVSWCPVANCLMSGSWDRTLQFWRRTESVVDGQRGMSHSLVHKIKTPERVYGADVCHDMAVVIIAGNASNVLLYRVADEISFMREASSPLLHQSRCVRAFGPQVNGRTRTEQNSGYVVGGIEGRCAVGYFDPSLSGENFAFKCHRDSDHAFAVNSVDFHPKHNSFATAGSDGTFVYWDKDSKSRLKAFSRIPTRGAITCGRFSADGSMFAYAQSYDWAKGLNPEMEAAASDCIRIHWTFLGHAGSDECIKKR